LITSAHSNSQLFSDHYLDDILPQHPDWQALSVNAEPIMAEIAAIFKKYKPSETEKEAQTEERFVRPVLRVLGHIFEVQPSLAAPGRP